MGVVVEVCFSVVLFCREHVLLGCGCGCGGGVEYGEDNVGMMLMIMLCLV